MTASPTVVIIDDHVNLARGFAIGLERAGYHVHVAHTAEDGLLLVQGKNPSAIVVDLRMPFINGAGFLYRLRTMPTHSRTPVMVVTGSAVNEEMRSELAELGAVVRFKPIAISELLAEVGALVSPNLAQA